MRAGGPPAADRRKALPTVGTFVGTVVDFVGVLNICRYRSIVLAQVQSALAYIRLMNTKRHRMIHVKSCRHDCQAQGRRFETVHPLQKSPPKFERLANRREKQLDRSRSSSLIHHPNSAEKENLQACV